MQGRFLSLFLILFLFNSSLVAEDGYRLWLRYDRIQNDALREDYISHFRTYLFRAESLVLKTAQKELLNGLNGLLNFSPQSTSSISEAWLLVASLQDLDPALRSEAPIEKLKEEGYLISSMSRGKILLIGHDEKGVLYGVFHLLRILQLQESFDNLLIIENPKIQLRLLNHWDNLDRSVERGYAGCSIWNWHELPDYIDPRYEDYARANASIGINGAVVTNVNANALVFRHDYLEKAAALAAVFRKHGIKLYLTARFSAPIELGKLESADPLDPLVQKWWKEKVDEIYRLIPDFGGFLVKANSEGQPGPQKYGRTHADGANLLADALKPYGGVVMWRAFVYSQENPDDRFKQAYTEFKPLDGSFHENVLIQVKNGPIDFQPREPLHPLFGAMPRTNTMLELQITKEYLGQGTHLVNLAAQWEEILQTNPGYAADSPTLSKLLSSQKLSGIAGVSNIGSARNWTNHLFAQADWFAFGKLAWNPDLKAKDIFQEWCRLTFTNEMDAVDRIVGIMECSWPACVNYMTPLGLHHIMAAGHHYGPGPWVDWMPRDDWNCTYYHQADSIGIGFDSTPSGSNALSQYTASIRARFANAQTCPLEFLLWFHHISWNQKLTAGNTLWEELCYRYQSGVNDVKTMKSEWEGLRGKIDEERHHAVAMHLDIQLKEAIWWKDACLAYFQSFSKLPFPENIELPEHPLEWYKNLDFPFAPGN